MRGPRSLKWRLVLSAVGIATVVVVVLTTLFLTLLNRRLHAEERSVLLTHVDAVAATISTDAHDRLVVQDGSADAVLDTGVWVFSGRTAIEHPSRVSPADDRVALSLAGTDGRVLRRDDADFASVGITGRAGQAGTVVAAISLTPYQRSAHLSVLGAIGFGVVLVALVGALSYRVAGRALAPVADMAQRARAWSAVETSERFGPAARPRELADLAADLDTLLDRLAAALRRERQLSAEISHELRTPLASIVAEAEVFLSKPRSARQSADAMTRVLDGARRLDSILDTLLVAARAEHAPNGRADVVATLQAMGLEPIGSSDLPEAGVDPAVLERLLGPVVDNAQRYGAVAHVQVRQEPGAVVLELTDDGPGIPVGSEERVFEPGLRLDPDDGHPGSGLGLALARRLAHACGAEITCVPGAHGHFVISLPRA